MDKILEIQERVDKMAYLVKSKEAVAIKQLLEDLRFLLEIVGKIHQAYKEEE